MVWFVSVDVCTRFKSSLIDMEDLERREQRDHHYDSPDLREHYLAFA